MGFPGVRYFMRPVGIDRHPAYRVFFCHYCLVHSPMLMSITDDHSPFLAAGIPAIDLIDFEFGPGHRYWHTEEDSIDKISSASLKIVGQTVLRFLETYDER